MIQTRIGKFTFWEQLTDKGKIIICSAKVGISDKSFTIIMDLGPRTISARYFDAGLEYKGTFTWIDIALHEALDTTTYGYYLLVWMYIIYWRHGSGAIYGTLTKAQADECIAPIQEALEGFSQEMSLHDDLRILPKEPIKGM